MPSAKRRTESTQNAEEEKRLARRKRRHDGSRKEILDVARQVLLSRGIAATTLEAVAKEVGMTKTALYYYYPSKDALLFELIFEILKVNAQTVHDAVEETKDGPGALRALIHETVKAFAPRLDDFRLAFLYGQVASPGALHFNAEQFARIRPLNGLWFGGVAEKLAQSRKRRAGHGQVEPRLMAFLAYLSALGLLTMKGMVESLDDPLIYSDEQLVDGFTKIFAAASTTMYRGDPA